MREKLLALLIAKFSGVRNDVLNHMARVFALQVTNDEDANKLVETLTDAQVSEFSKEFRADVDKEVSDSTKTFEANLRKKYDLVDKKQTEPGGGQTPKNQEDLQAQIDAAVAKAVQPFKDKDLASSRLQALTEKLNGCKDETFKAQTLKDFSRMTFESDDAFNEYLNEKATDIETANQHLADEQMHNGGGKPMFSQKDENGVSQSVAAFIESQKPANDQFAGKEL